MGYRIVFLTNPVKLSVKNEQLVIDNGELTKVPLEADSTAKNRKSGNRAKALFH